LNAIQLHGDLNEYSNIKFINELKKFFHLIRCFPVENEKDVKKALDFKNVLIPLFDCKTELFGGSGKIFDWNLLKKYRNKFEFFILAGGLNSENVKDAIKIVKPPVVDVSSGVELKPGRKDKMKMIKFIKSVKSFD
jgi:phosphoribosylanthranilate isomerase